MKKYTYLGLSDDDYYFFESIENKKLIYIHKSQLNDKPDSLDILKHNYNKKVKFSSKIRKDSPITKQFHNLTSDITLA
ncbi:hypothetical protein HOE31_04695 [bacterium]|nr:hypothetical protein [bacterium]